MYKFYHCYTRKYERRLRIAMILTITPLAQFGMLILWALLFNLKRLSERDFAAGYLAAEAVVTAAGMLLCWFYGAVSEHYIRVNGRFTYFEILPKAAVFSRYKGGYSLFGKRTVIRRVCVIPLKDYESAYLDESRKHLILTGKIRVYEGEDRSLGYHVKDGFPDFDRWWYNEADSSRKTVDMMKLPMDFAKPAKIACALEKAKLEFNALPPKKAYVFKEADIVRKRKELKKLAESRRYMRTW